MIGEILAFVLYLVIFAAMTYRLIAARKEAQYWKAVYADLIESLKKYKKEEHQ